jgi:hypothetical protein
MAFEADSQLQNPVSSLLALRVASSEEAEDGSDEEVALVEAADRLGVLPVLRAIALLPQHLWK